MERIYKKFGISDLHLVIGMENDFRNGFVCEDNVRQFLLNPQNWIFTCIESERIIGFIYGYELNRLNDIGNMLYIHEVGVLPDFQRQGIGKQLFENIKILCKLTGICKFFLNTQKSNIAACGLYESVGGLADHDDSISYYFNL